MAKSGDASQAVHSLTQTGAEPDGEGDASASDLVKMLSVVSEVENNFREVITKYQELKKADEQGISTLQNHVLVPKQDLLTIKGEIGQLRGNLLTSILPEIPKLQKIIEDTENENQTLKKEMEFLTTELDHWKSRCNTSLAEVERQKEEKFGLQVELQASNEQIRQQLEYCSAMGAACCTLLWRVSRCEESIQAILVGTQVDEFLTLVSSTLESYVATYTDEVPQENTEETQFVLALCGIITNIAASPFGREFLINNAQGQNLVTTFLGILRIAPGKQCSKMKNLLLMSLYNLSINQKGLKAITSEPGVLSFLIWIVQKESLAEIRLHALRLIQSLLYDSDNVELLSEANEVLTTKLLQQLATDNCRAIRELSLELATDLKTMSREN